MSYPDTDWMDDAFCRLFPKEIFFDDQREDEAKALCAVCAVQQQCLSYATTIPGRKVDIYGVWGGLSQYERRGLTRTYAVRKPPTCGEESGYRKHLKDKTEVCILCRLAHRKSTNDWKAKKRAKNGRSVHPLQQRNDA